MILHFDCRLLLQKDPVLVRHPGLLWRHTSQKRLLAKLNLALALLADPAVLLLDEPYAGFDWDTYLRFWDLVQRRRVAGRAVLVISHFIADEHRFDRIIELRDGKATVK